MPYCSEEAITHALPGSISKPSLELTKLPILMKDITHPADAILAMEHGADGIIVSNHGGQQLDSAIATMDALPEIAKAVNGAKPIILDSGIRRGADIIKAISLGAKARINRKTLAVAGESGVREVIKHFIAETELQLAIAGRGSISDIDASLIMKT